MCAFFALAADHAEFPKLFVQVNLRNQALVEALDQQLGEQQHLAANSAHSKSPPPSDEPAPRPGDAQPSVDEHVTELSRTLQQA